MASFTAVHRHPDGRRRSRRRARRRRPSSNPSHDSCKISPQRPSSFLRRGGPSRALRPCPTAPRPKGPRGRPRALSPSLRGPIVAGTSSATVWRSASSSWSTSSCVQLDLGARNLERRRVDDLRGGPHLDGGRERPGLRSVVGSRACTRALRSGAGGVRDAAAENQPPMCHHLPRPEHPFFARSFLDQHGVAPSPCGSCNFYRLVNIVRGARRRARVRAASTSTVRRHMVPASSSTCADIRAPFEQNTVRPPVRVDRSVPLRPMRGPTLAAWCSESSCSVPCSSSGSPSEP